MRKDRNTFFNESGFQASYGMGMPMNYGSQASQSFYSGSMPMNQNTNYDYSSELESRMSKIERQLNRIDARLSKLEAKGTITSENFDSSTNMYML